MDYMKLGNLRSKLIINKYNPHDKYESLYWIAKSLLALHKCNLVHGDFHSGNLLLFDHEYTYISDLGLSQTADKSSIESNEVYGVLPYIAPEVLRSKLYTKAADLLYYFSTQFSFYKNHMIVNQSDHKIHMIFNQ